MKRKGDNGLPVLRRNARAANDDFISPDKGPDGIAPGQPSWDPYEVWRTRVRESPDPQTEREGRPLT